MWGDCKSTDRRDSNFSGEPILKTRRQTRQIIIRFRPSKDKYRKQFLHKGGLFSLLQ